MMDQIRIKKENKKKKTRTMKTGKGLLNKLIDKIPFEMHMPGGFQYCGPGTKLKERLARGDPGINKLDKACKKHDIAYEVSKDDSKRKEADNVLAQEAWERVKAKDSSFGEKVAAVAVASAMKVKSGTGFKRMTKNNGNRNKTKRKECKPTAIQKAIKAAKSELAKVEPADVREAVNVALKAAKATIKQEKTKKTDCKKIPRIIPIPKIGGALPLIPIFAGLSAIGSLIGGSAAVANAVNTTNNAKKNLFENQRHNEQMEAIALGKRNKKGYGVYLKRYRNGLGLYLTEKKNIKKSKN